MVWLPVIYLSSFALRAAVMFATFPLLQFLGQEPVSWRDIVFITVGGVRGSLSLILAQSVVAEESSTTTERVEGKVRGWPVQQAPTAAMQWCRVC